MDAMTILIRCRRSNADLAELEEKARQRRDAVTTITAALDREGGRGPATDRIASAAAAVADIETQAERRRERQAVELVAVVQLSDMLPGIQGRIIYLYYGKALTVRAVAKRVKYTEGYVRRLRRIAEDTLRMLPEAQVESLVPQWYIRGTEEVRR